MLHLVMTANCCWYLIIPTLALLPPLSFPSIQLPLPVAKQLLLLPAQTEDPTVVESRLGHIKPEMTAHWLMVANALVVAIAVLSSGCRRHGPPSLDPPRDWEPKWTRFDASLMDPSMVVDIESESWFETPTYEELLVAACQSNES